MSTNQKGVEQSYSLEHFNCIVMIVNKSRDVMRLHGTPVNNHGDYDPPPPNEIDPGKIVSFILKHTNWSPFGTEGSCAYSCAGTNGYALVELSYSCPSGTGLNSADAVVQTGTGISVQMIPNPLPESGHPVNVQFTVE